MPKAKKEKKVEAEAKPPKWRRRLAIFLFFSAGIIVAAAVALLATIPLRSQVALDYVDKAVQALALQNFDQAQADLAKARLLAPSLGAVYLQRGFLFEAKGDFGRAIQSFEKAYNLDQKQTQAAYKAGEILWEKNKDLQAKDWLAKSGKGELLLGQIAISEADYSQARQYFESIGSENEAQYFLGILTASYNKASAKKHFESVKSGANKNDAKLMKNFLSLDAYPLSIYGALADRGFGAMIVNDAKNYADANPTSRDGWTVYAYVLLSLGKYSEAQNAIAKALVIDPIYAYGNQLLSEINNQLGDKQAAAEAEKKAELFK